MSMDCPLCGSPLERSERTLRIHVLQCDSCHHHFSVLPHSGALSEATEGEALAPMVATGPGPSGGTAAEGGAAAATPGDDDSPVCGTCGSDLQIRAVDETTIEVECPKCDETTRFRAETEEGEDRPAPPSRDRRPARSFDSDAPRARGCRRCGGPLEFEPTSDGGRIGRCSQCGNEFRLPPRREDDGGGGGYGRSRPGGFRRFNDRGGRGGPRGPPGGRRPSYGPPRRRFGRSSDNDEEDDDRPRRPRRTSSARSSGSD